jgi:hypothetical protein
LTKVQFNKAINLERKGKAMILKNPYDTNGKWLRGSFHIHTTFSGCGWHSIHEIELAYHDYDFLAITDHDYITNTDGHFNGKTIFNGFEVSSPECHMLLVNTPDNIMDNFTNEFTIENYQRLSNTCIKAGGISILNHPNRIHGQQWDIKNMIEMTDYTGMEVFSGDGINIEEDIAFDKWDELLTQGKKVWGFGNDDFHHFGQERRVWNVVLAAENTKEAIMKSIKSGSFYVSSGFGFRSIVTDGNKIIVNLKKNDLFDRMYKYVTLFGSEGKVLCEKTGKIDSVEYECSGDEGYVRVAAYLEGGYAAFSQPIFITK